MNTYREPGRDVDMTEIERTKIHEAEETRRKAIDAREATKRERIKSVDTGGYVVTRLAFAIVALGAVVASYYGYASYNDRLAPPPPPSCKEAAAKKSDRSSLVCDPGQALIEDRESWRCVCPRLDPKPAASQ